MKLKTIVDALNYYLYKVEPNALGWFIGKESMEPTRINAYKRYKAEIFYHTPGKNTRMFTQEFVDRFVDISDEDFKERFFTALLGQIFENLDKIIKHETI